MTNEFLTLTTQAAHALSTTQRAVALTLSGTKATDRKRSALGQADQVGRVLISHGNGSIAKEAREDLGEAQRDGAAKSIANGNLHAFATAWAARTGEAVKFGLKNEDGSWKRRPSEDFRAFRNVIEHAMTQLESRGKALTAKGQPTNAMADLMYMMSLHTAAVRYMDERDEADAKRRAEEAEAKRLELAEEAAALEALIAAEKAEAGAPIQA